MLAVLILSGDYKAQGGYLLKVDGRTSEVALRNQVVRVDTGFLHPLDIAHSFDEIDNMVKEKILTMEK